MGPNDTAWALTQTSFECRACGHRSPLNHLDVDGTVLCLSCGIEQRFDRDQWWDAIRHAHAVADGMEEPGAEFQNFEEQQLELRATPGSPVCSTCRTPLRVVPHGGADLRVHCAGCAKERRYALPEKLSQRVSGLIGIIADEHEVGPTQAELRDENGVSALRCPTCGAALSVTGASTIVTCASCSNSCRVHPRALPKTEGGTASALPVWLLFKGPSLAREREQRSAEKAAAQREKAAQERLRRAAQAVEFAPATPRRKKGKRPAWVDWLAISAVVVLSVGFGVWESVREEQREKDAQEKQERDLRAVREAARRKAEDETRETSSPKEQGTPYSFSVTMDATKVEGLEIAKGEPCTIAVQGTGEKPDHVLLQCQKAVLYDSSTQVAGMRMMAWELFSSGAGAPPDGLRYSDTGQRSNGTEVSIDTKLGQAAAWSQVVPIFRVELRPHQDKPKPKLHAKPKP